MTSMAEDSSRAASDAYSVARHGLPSAERPVAPTIVRDELAWELVRDEWELLLAIGSGPTSAEVAAHSLGLEIKGVERRIEVLERHGVVASNETGYALVPAFYERREGMSSYLRDLVLQRLQADSTPPLAGGVFVGLGGASALQAAIDKAEATLFPRVVELASLPEGKHAERFSVFFAVADAPEASAPDAGFRQQLLSVLRASATQRSSHPETRSAYLWVAEMRTNPETAVAVGEAFQGFCESLPSPFRGPSGQTPALGGTAPVGAGAAVFAVLPATAQSRRAS